MSKRIYNLKKGKISGQSLFRVQGSSGEDKSINIDGVTQSMLAEKVMQGANIELANAITNNKRQLSIILSDKGTTIDQNASYSEFEQAIKNLEVESDYVIDTGSVIDTIDNGSVYNQSLDSQYVSVVYLTTKPLAVCFSSSGVVDLFSIEYKDEGILYNKLYTITIEGLDLSTKEVTTRKSFRDTYVSLSYWDKSQVNVISNIILKIGENTIEKIELTEQQKEWLGDFGINSIDDSFTMIGTVQNMSQLQQSSTITAINIQTGQTYAPASGTISRTRSEYWLTATSLIINVWSDYNYASEPYVLHFSETTYESTKLFSDTTNYSYFTIVDIPEKNKSLFYSFVPYSDSYYNEQILHRLIVGYVDYFSGSSTKIYDNFVPIFQSKINLSSNMREPDNNINTFYKTDKGFLVVPPALFYFGAFIISDDLLSLSFPYISSGITTSYVNGSQFITQLVLNNMSVSLYKSSTVYYIFIQQIRQNTDLYLHYHENKYMCVN